MVIQMQTIREIANYLKAWRLQNTTMRQEDVGVEADLSKQHYQRIESGSDLKLSTLLAVLDVLGLEIRLIPKRKRIRNANEIDRLVAKARLKAASNFQYLSHSSNKAGPSELEAVFGSRLSKRKKTRSGHIPGNVKVHKASSERSSYKKQKEKEQK